jgi:hypothetical protein
MHLDDLKLLVSNLFQHVGNLVGAQQCAIVAATADVAKGDLGGVGDRRRGVGQQVKLKQPIALIHGLFFA